MVQGSKVYLKPRSLDIPFIDIGYVEVIPCFSLQLPVID
jgi:hypothetical protein